MASGIHPNQDPPATAQKFQQLAQGDTQAFDRWSRIADIQLHLSAVVAGAIVAGDLEVGLGYAGGYFDLDHEASVFLDDERLAGHDDLADRPRRFRQAPDKADPG